MKIKTAILLCLAMLIPNISWAETFNVQGYVVTGLNRILGQPAFVFPEVAPFPEGIGFNTVAEFNPNGPDPLPLTPASPDGAILASMLDPFFDPPNFPPADPSLANVQLRDVATWVFPPDLQSRAALAPHLSAPALAYSQAEPNSPTPITLEDWFKAEGKMKIKCNDDGNSVKIRLKGLVPNRLYTVWALWVILDENDPRNGIWPQPLGGVPNAYMTDDKGRATFKRELNFCPPEAAETGVNGNVFLTIATHLHSDGVAYGGLPSPIAAGFPPGTVLHATLEWNMGNGIPLAGPGGDNDSGGNGDDDEEDDD